MADNRIYIRCLGCGEELFLGKRLGAGYYWRNYHEKEKHLEDYLNDFYDRHDYCGSGYDHYVLAYEDEPDFDVADIVSVVRCKDCKYMTEDYYSDGNVPDLICSEWDSGTDYDGYCHYGERRADDERND